MIRDANLISLVQSPLPNSYGIAAGPATHSSVWNQIQNARISVMVPMAAPAATMMAAWGPASTSSSSRDRTGSRKRVALPPCWAATC